MHRLLPALSWHFLSSFLMLHLSKGIFAPEKLEVWEAGCYSVPCGSPHPWKGCDCVRTLGPRLERGSGGLQLHVLVAIGQVQT